ncbi:cupin domain-containing protein [Oculatella sp. LEGE 06141]|uniref:cupin domain-containing protein n=1 Tax=Oculatella sp. LEGE 06141 TaxID=1828648 RepID=UPI001881C89F|nr:cupin domain-containing protein [Oculatella sp. LEGE 06141]MBE9182103.1 cupin domain-containing protein [Oculatella sp. LEGE 06141]
MTRNVTPLNINSTYVVLENDGDATPIPVSDRFFEDLEHQFGDFKGKRLVSYFTFEQDWDTWEMHPTGEEFVCLLSGQVELILEQGGVEHTVQLSTPGCYVLVPRGTWHTARVQIPSSMLFITPGEGTQNRPLSQPTQTL